MAQTIDTNLAMRTSSEQNLTHYSLVPFFLLSFHLFLFFTPFSFSHLHCQAKAPVACVGQVRSSGTCSNCTLTRFQPIQTTSSHNFRTTFQDIPVKSKTFSHQIHHHSQSSNPKHQDCSGHACQIESRGRTHARRTLATVGSDATGRHFPPMPDSHSPPK